ncbi:MAG: alcohol dehydrogenase catalytic domain-containing protein [Clostridiales bacterium]|nr:alcohol dehydrogenase catalytic domain-containing protein [Clostridiales bacterium]
MKAVVVYSPHHFAVVDRPMPQPPAGWARVRLAAAAFCATDLEVLSGGIPARYPITPGHEWCGVVDSVNGADPDWIGKRVSGSNDVCCLTCRACRSGLWRNCKQFGEIGFAHDGAYAEYMLVPEYALRRLPDHVTDEQAALLEPLGVAIGTLDKAQAAMGDSLLILGAGSIGLNMLLVARAAGLRDITVVERSGGRLPTALALGADHALASSQCDLRAELARIYPGGPDIIVDCTGAEECVALALSIAPKSGRVALAGYGGGRTMAIRIDDIHIKNLRVVGAGNNWDVIDRAIDLVAGGLVDPSPLVSVRARLDDFEGVARQAAERAPGFVKAIFEMG